MEKTNEQILNDIENEGRILKKNYSAELFKLLDCNCSTTIENQLLIVHDNATKYFNHYELFVGKSDLLDGYNNKVWAKGFYETCFNILENIIRYYDSIYSICNKNKIDKDSYKPSSFSYGSMQRVCFNYLISQRDEVETLRKDFEKLELPIKGFVKMNYRKLSLFEKIAGFSFGTVFIFLIFLTAIFIPNPTPYQYKIFRMIISVSAAGVGGVLTGFIHLEGKAGFFSIRAGGALALGLVFYLINPAVL